jgi:hypothetical protein
LPWSSGPTVSGTLASGARVPKTNAEGTATVRVARLHPAVLAGALWAAVAVRLVRRQLQTRGLRATVIPPPPIGQKGGRGVRAALRRYSPTCLERALVEQAWLASVGSLRDVVIGVPPDGIRSAPAHAWVDGFDTASPAKYLELHRLPPPSHR